MRIYSSPIRKRHSIFFWLEDMNITNYIIIINVLAFILVNIIFSLFGLFNNFDCGIGACKYLTLQANNLFQKGYVWTLFTSMFMHSGFGHLFVNMISLFFVGNFLEMLIGRRRFLWFYLASGVFAGLFFSVLAFLFGNSLIGGKIFGTPFDYAVGASGAIFAIVGALALLLPRKKVYLIIGPLVAIILGALVDNYIKVNWALQIISFLINAYFFISIFFVISPNTRFRKIAFPVEMPFWLLPIVAIVPLVVIGLFITLPIGNMAHLGGLLAGIFYGLFLKLKYKRKSKLLAESFND
jgi:membrane associated rhomboid family serine protease